MNKAKAWIIWENRAMERFALRQNIAVFQRALARETDIALRQTVWDLLADAEAELAQLEAAAAAPTEITAAEWPAPRIPYYGNGAEHIGWMQNDVGKS